MPTTRAPAYPYLPSQLSHASKEREREREHRRRLPTACSVDEKKQFSPLVKNRMVICKPHTVARSATADSQRTRYGIRPTARIRTCSLRR